MVIPIPFFQVTKVRFSSSYLILISSSGPASGIFCVADLESLFRRNNDIGGHHFQTFIYEGDLNRRQLIYLIS